MRITYTVIASIACGWFVYLVYEAPFINLGKAMFIKKKSLLQTATTVADADGRSSLLDLNNNQVCDVHSKTIKKDN